MLYSLDAQEVRRLRQLDFRAEFTNAEMLIAVYKTDPAVVARILPKPLKPPPEPLVMAFVARYPQTNFGCVYDEGALVVVAGLHGKMGGYCVSMPVNDDTALIAGRELHGFPKKMAELIRLEHDGKIVGRVVRKGTEILRIELEPSAPADLTSFAAFAPAEIDQQGRPCLSLSSYLFKFFRSSSGKRFDYLPRLVKQTTLLRPRPGLRMGAGKVVVTSSPFDPLGEVPVIGAPLFVVHGFWDNTMLPGKVVAHAWNPWSFLKYAFFKDDMIPTLLGTAPTVEPAPSRSSEPLGPPRISAQPH